MIKCFSPVLFVPGHVPHWSRPWFLGLISQIHLKLPHHLVLTGWSLGCGHHHWTWSWLLFTAWPWTCLFPMVLPNDLDPWVALITFLMSVLPVLAWWGWASAIKVSVLLWYLGSPPAGEQLGLSAPQHNSDRVSRSCALLCLITE